MFPKISSFFLCLSLVIFGCSKDDGTPPEPLYEIPVVYNFNDVNYDGQLTRLAMLAELKAYLSSANESGVSLDESRLSAMYSNDASKANWSQDYDESKQLKGKTFENEQEVFENLLSAITEASISTEVASEGVAGRISSLDGAKTYLLGANGLEFTQLIEKGLMGACLYYQATAVYFGDEKMNVDNEVVEPGEGTAMEHHWDEAFGYFGVPIDFPINTDGLVFWGNYSNSRNALLGCNQSMMDGFLRGRAAISNDDLESRDEAIDAVRSQWELISVGTAMHYLNSATANFEDLALRAHSLSEAIAFIYSLQFNPSKKLDNATVADLLKQLAGASTFEDMNIYPTTTTDLITVRDFLANAFDLEAIKEEF